MALSGVSRLYLALSTRCISHQGTYIVHPTPAYLYTGTNFAAKAIRRTLSRVSSSTTQSQSFTSVAAVPNNTKENGETSRQWRVAAGICVLRMPSLSVQKDPLTVEFEALQDQIKFEKSKLSDFELQELEHNRAKKARAKKALEDERPESEGSDQADEFDDLIEARELEVKAFEPAVRETEADRSGDMQSHNRKLDRVLYLLVKKPREEHAWQMPQGGVEPDESLLECAKRELLEECGSDLDVRFYSPAPHAVYTYRHPPLSQSNPKQTGSKVFFMKAYCSGNGEVKLNKKELVDYMWVTKEEMKDYVGQGYYDIVKKILIE